MSQQNRTNAAVPDQVSTDNQTALASTPWMLLPGNGEHVFSANVEDVSSALGTFIVEARTVNADLTRGPTKTIFSSTLATDFPQTGRLAGYWEVRGTCSAYTSGTYNFTISR